VERSSGAAPPRQPGRSGQSDDLLDVRVDQGDGAAVLELAGELDLSTVPKLEDALFERVGAEAAVVVDLSRVVFIDSSGIGLLIRAFRSLNGRGPMLTVIAPGSQIERLFKIAGIDGVLPLFADREKALSAIAAEDS